jgi:type IV pilus assembly protein PilA
MAVVAIVSILALVALSAYSTFADRSKVSEALSFAAEAKTSISEAYYNTNEIPEDNFAAGLPSPTSYNRYDWVSKLEVGTDPMSGTVTMFIKIPSLGNNNQLQLIPRVENGLMYWECKPAATDGIARSKVPANCRN